MSPNDTINDKIKKLIIGSRKSQLALVQTYFVRDLLVEAAPSLEVTVSTYTTKGDKVLDVSLANINDKALFTKELDLALMENQVDLVVHSLKDIPTLTDPDLLLSSFIKRELALDVVVIKAGLGSKSLDELSDNSVVGTSSVRRIAQLRHKYQNLVFKSVRGNLNTRLNKLDSKESEYSAIILAYAGLKRLGLENRVSSVLDFKDCMPAVGQGVIAVVSRRKDESISWLLKKINDSETEYICSLERAYLKKLEGGCSVPIGIYSEKIPNDRYIIHACITSLDGANQVNVSRETIIEDYTDLKEARDHGESLALELLQNGGDRLLSEIRQSNININ